MVSVKCEGCGTRFDAKRASAKWCSTRCKRRAVHGAVVTPLRSRPVVDVEPVIGVYAATLAELVAAGVVSSWKGQSALLLASRLDAPSADTASSVAALAREHAARMDAACAGGRRGDDLLDDLKDRREARLRGA